MSTTPPATPPPTTPPETSPVTPGDPPVRPGWVLLGVTVGLVALVVLLRLGGGAPQPQPEGLPDPGPVTGWGLPVVGYLGTLLGIGVVGGLMVPLLVLSSPGAELRGRSHRAVHSLRFLVPAWLAVTVADLALTYSDQFAVPPARIGWSGLWGWAVVSDQGRALLLQLAMITLVALARRWILTGTEATFLLVLAIGALLPPVFTGHSAAAGSHDTAVISLLVHVVAVSLWVGGVVALWWHLRSTPRTRAVAARRFALLAAWCFGVTAASGVVNALVRLGSPGALLTSDYGRGVLAKIVVLVLVGLVAARVRTAVEHRRTDAGWGRLSLLTGLELLLLTLAVALGAGLGRTPPPVGEPYTSAAESLLGGPLPPPPTPVRLLTELTPSGIGLLVVGLGGVAYLVGLVAVRRHGGRWPVGRTLSWYAGLLLVGYATTGGLGTYSHVMFSAHMASHMMLSMVAPVFLVSGAPVTLALRSLPGADVVSGKGPRHWLAAVLRSAPVRVLTHPLVVAALFVGSLYAIYFTGLFPRLMESHLGHAFMELHFLLVGYLFFEVLIGHAPVPRRPPHLARLGLLLVVVPFHAFFAVAVMSSTTVLGEEYYRVLDRNFATDLLADQYLAGSMTWALGEVPVVLVLVVLLAQWYRSDTRAAQRHDRRSDRDDGAELAAYNAALTRLAEHERRDA